MRTKQQSKNIQQLQARLRACRHEPNPEAYHEDRGHFRIEAPRNFGEHDAWRAHYFLNGRGPASVLGHLLDLQGVPVQAMQDNYPEEGLITYIALTLGFPFYVAARLYHGTFPEGQEPEDVPPSRVVEYIQE